MVPSAWILVPRHCCCSSASLLDVPVALLLLYHQYLALPSAPLLTSRRCRRRKQRLSLSNVGLSAAISAGSDRPRVVNSTAVGIIVLRSNTALLYLATPGLLVRPWRGSDFLVSPFSTLNENKQIKNLKIAIMGALIARCGRLHRAQADQDTS